MDKKFLHKVIDQIVSETSLDYNEKKIYYPFSFYPLSLLHHTILHSPSLYSSFFEHCKNVYGLNGKYNDIYDNEVDYVWDEYKKIIYDKIKTKDKPKII